MKLNSTYQTAREKLTHLQVLQLLISKPSIAVMSLKRMIIKKKILILK